MLSASRFFRQFTHPIRTLTTCHQSGATKEQLEYWKTNLPHLYENYMKMQTNIAARKNDPTQANQFKKLDSKIIDELLTKEEENRKHSVY